MGKVKTQADAEQTANELLEKYGYISIAGPPAHKGQVLGNVRLSSTGGYFQHPLVVTGESSLEEFNQQRRHLGMPLWSDPDDHFFRVVAE